MIEWLRARIVHWLFREAFEQREPIEEPLPEPNIVWEGPDTLAKGRRYPFHERFEMLYGEQLRTRLCYPSDLEDRADLIDEILDGLEQLPEAEEPPSW